MSVSTNSKSLLWLSGVSLTICLASIPACALFGLGAPAEQQAEATPAPTGPDTNPRLTGWMPDWMYADGTVDDDYIYATVRNKCAEGVVVRITTPWEDGPRCTNDDCSKTVEPWFEEYNFFNERNPKARTGHSSLAELFTPDIRELGDPVFWTKTGDVNAADQGWKKQEQIAAKFGERYALEVQEDCVTLAPREPNLRLHKCYKWHYSDACGVDRETSETNSAEPAIACGDGSQLSVEGDPTNPVCTFETENGFCRIAAGKLREDCPRR